MQATSVALSGYANARNKADIRHFFEHTSRGHVVFDLTADEGLSEVRFGEYLVEQGLIDRYQLFRALQLQDRRPGIRVGEAAVALGYASPGAIERMFDRFQDLATIDVA